MINSSVGRFASVHLLWIAAIVLAARPFAAAAQSSRAVWNIAHAYGPTGKTNVEKIQEGAKHYNVNSVELDILFHTDRFHGAHDYSDCDPDRNNRETFCLELVPLLQEVESNPNITMLWIDTKAQTRWKTESGRLMLLADLAEVVREYVKTKAIWWGLGVTGALSRGDVEELVSRAPLPPLEGVSYDYGKNTDYSVTIQDIYLRARKAGIEHIGHSNKPGFRKHSCFEFNKAFAYLAEGKLTRVLSWTINDEATIKGLYLSDGAVVTTCGGGEDDEQQILGAVEGIISDLFTGTGRQRDVIDADPTLRYADSSDVFWPRRSLFGVEPRFDNLMANGGAEMPPLPGGLASSWRLGHTNRAGVLSLTAAGCPSVSAHHGSRYLALPARCVDSGSTTTIMYQDIVVQGYQAEIDAETMSATIRAAVFVGGGANTVALKGFLSVSYVGLAGSKEETFWAPSSDDSQGTWVSAEGTVRVPSGTEIIRVSVGAETPASPTCEQPQWDASASPATCPSGHLYVDDVSFAFYPTITPTASASSSPSVSETRTTTPPSTPTTTVSPSASSSRQPTSSTSQSPSRSSTESLVASPSLTDTRTMSSQRSPTVSVSHTNSWSHHSTPSSTNTPTVSSTSSNSAVPSPTVSETKTGSRTLFSTRTFSQTRSKSRRTTTQTVSPSTSQSEKDSNSPTPSTSTSQPIGEKTATSTFPRKTTTTRSSTNKVTLPQDSATVTATWPRRGGFETLSQTRTVIPPPSLITRTTTDSVVTTRTPTATVAPTQPPPSTTDAPTPTPSPAPTPVPTLAPPTRTITLSPQLTRREYSFRLSGSSWSGVIATNKAALLAAVQEDVGDALGISPNRVEVVSVSVGSLVAHVAVVTDDQSEPDLSNSTLVADALSGSEYSSTKAAYVASGGPSSETLSVLNVAIVGESTPPPTASTESPTHVPPQTTPNNNLAHPPLDNSDIHGCGTGCMFAIVFFTIVVGFAVALGLVVVIVRRRRDAKVKTSRGE